MTKDEGRMPKEARSPNDECLGLFACLDSGGGHSSPLQLMRKVTHKPVIRQLCDVFQRGRFFK
jgi:hypothetical protein